MSKTTRSYTAMLVRMSKKNYVKDIAQSKKEPAKKNITLNFREKFISLVQSLEIVLIIMYAYFMVAEHLHSHEGYYFPYKTPVDDKERL
jgi:hypothetical protein